VSIWGKIVGGAAGYALGGPLGGLVGAMAGHVVDRYRQTGAGDLAEGDGRDATKRIAFTIAVIVLGAKMAKADGTVTRDEINAFRQVFHVPPRELKNVGRVFDRARRDARGFEPYARQIARMFRNNPAVLEELLDALFHVASADRVVSPRELEYLSRVAAIFGFDERRFDRIRAEHLGPDEADPYRVLGLDPTTADDKLKTTYRRLVRENHPDRLIAQGLPAEFVDLANQKLARINAAYDEIRDERGLR
jgi:DnaJ like chaperone protein